MATFKRPDTSPSQQFLFARFLDEMLDKDAPVRQFRDVLDRLDWQTLEASYTGVGRPPYDPRILSSLLIYAYSQGIRASRKIEELACYDLRYMWLACEMQPDYRTLARFRKDRFELLKMLFAQSVRLCMEEGLVTLDLVAVDGTKVRARASGRGVYDNRRLEGEIAYAESVLNEARQTDEDEDKPPSRPASSKLPRKIQDPQKRLERLEEMREDLGASGARTLSATDPESRLMKIPDIRNNPAFNTQAAVDSHSQVVVGLCVTNFEADYGLLPDMLDEMESNTHLQASVVVADAGYSDGRTLQDLDKRGQEAFIAQPRFSSRFSGDPAFALDKFDYEASTDSFVCPSGQKLTFRRCKATQQMARIYTAKDCQSCPCHSRCVKSGRPNRSIEVAAAHQQRKKMIERVTSDDGRKVMKRRKTIVEPVFGQWKSSRRLDRLVTWGLSGAWAEMSLMALAHNLAKCAQIWLFWPISVTYPRQKRPLEAIRDRITLLSALRRKNQFPSVHYAL